MRVYLSQSSPTDGSFQHFESVARFSRGVMDSEATIIVCDSFLSCFSYDDVPSVLKLLMQKMRSGCELTIIEPDFYLISKQAFHQSVDMATVNKVVFGQLNALKCFLSLEEIEGLVSSDLEVVSKHFDEQSFKSILKLKRR